MKKTNRQKEIEQFKNGIFALRTNFGELAQLMIQKKMGFKPSDGNSYDLQDSDGRKIEVKFSRAYKKISLTEENAIEICTNCSTTVYNSSEAENDSSNYDCNIEQLKPDCFNSLYYGVFFMIRLRFFVLLVQIFQKAFAASSETSLRQKRIFQDIHFSTKVVMSASFT